MPKDVVYPLLHTLPMDRNRVAVRRSVYDKPRSCTLSPQLDGLFGRLGAAMMLPGACELRKRICGWQYE